MAASRRGGIFVPVAAHQAQTRGADGVQRSENVSAGGTLGAADARATGNTAGPVDMRSAGDRAGTVGSDADAWPLACPVCGRGLRRRPGALGCSAGHAFDIAREGYVNLLPSQHKTRGIVGDVPEMLHARRRFLERGYFRPLLELLTREVERALPEPDTAPAGSDGRACVLEVGSGEGYYIGSIAQGPAGVGATVFLGADLSKSAARLAAKRYPHATFIVDDVNRGICVEGGTVSALLDIFAPRNPAEFARVLAPDGVALVVIPSDAHLASARTRLGLLDIQQDKERQVLDRFAIGFALSERTELRYPIELDAEAANDLAQMGPSYWHQSEEHASLVGQPLATEASFVILRLHKTADAS